MNKAKRISLRRALTLLEQASGLVYDVRSDEQYCLENLPENFQESGRGLEMDNAIDKMEDAMDSIGEARDYISEAIG